MPLLSWHNKTEHTEHECQLTPFDNLNCEFHSLLSSTHHQVGKANNDPGIGAGVCHDTVGRDNLLVEGDTEVLVRQLLRRQHLGGEHVTCENAKEAKASDL